ncbi:hypothetical protein PInf_005289 [Phytophthora infestans]|nr:hypothetical protein PInf_005289 [Phytophthora infestans]
METNSESPPSPSEELVSLTNPSELDLRKYVAAESAEPQARPPDPYLPAAAPFTKRKWTEDDMLALACAWRAVYVAGIPKDEKTTMTNARILRKYTALCPSSTRSRNAVEDKLQSLREMYRFIRDVNASRIAGSTGKADWFE